MNTEKRISLDDQIKCAIREIAMRRTAYPRWVESRRLTQAKADSEIAAMEAILETLKDAKRTDEAA